MGSRTVDYFVLVVVLSVPFWVIGALTGSQLAESLPVSALMIVSPLAAALLITARGAERHALELSRHECSSSVWSTTPRARYPRQPAFMPSTNMSWLMFPNFGSHYDPRVTAPLTIAAAAVVTLRWGPRTLSHRRCPVNGHNNDLRRV